MNWHRVAWLFAIVFVGVFLVSYLSDNVQTAFSAAATVVLVLIVWGLTDNGR